MKKRRGLYYSSSSSPGFAVLVTHPDVMVDTAEGAIYVGPGSDVSVGLLPVC